MLYKKNSVVACIIAVFVSFFAVVPISHAQVEGIVVVDIQQLEGVSVAGKSLKEKISSKRKGRIKLARNSFPFSVSILYSISFSTTILI